jgi:hypothetical protein
MRTRETTVTAGAVVLLSYYRRRTVSLALAPLLLGVLATLVPLSHASPPDPTWIAGFYDDADFDDVVLAIVSADVLASLATPAVAVPEAIGHRLVRARALVCDHRPRLTANRSPPLLSA